MKKLLFIIIFLTILFTVSCGGNHQKDIIFFSDSIKNAIIPIKMDICDVVRDEKNDFFNLLVVKNKNRESIYDSYILLVKNNRSGKLYKLFTLSSASLNSELIKINKNYYSYEYFSGGNNVNAECYQLIKIDEKNVFLIGKYKGVFDVDNDGKTDFYILLPNGEFESHATAEYSRIKLDIKDNLFIYPNSYFKY